MRIRKNARGSARGNEKGKEAGEENPRHGGKNRRSGCDAGEMFLCVATLQAENAHTVVPTCRAVREGWGRLLQNTQQTKEIVSEMNFQLKLREEDAAKG